MRLTILERGHRLPARLFITTVSRLSRVEMSDVPKTLLYRPEFAGRTLLDLSADAMRGPSYWTAAEREYLAMSLAKLLRCPYCAVTHEELVRIAATGEIDPTDANTVRPELRAALAFLEHVTGDPDSLTAAHLEPIRQLGVPDDAIVEALRVAVVWNVVNRLANAFDFQLRSGQLEKGTRSLHRFGYRFPSFVTGPRPFTNDEPISSGRNGLVDRLRYTVLKAPAITDPATRMAAATGGPLPEPAATYAATVRDQSHRITDTDIDRMGAAGYGQDAIYEITVAAAVGAALHRYDTALTRLHDGT
jgi:alkylhydroperoxidase family enzyme